MPWFFALDPQDAAKIVAVSYEKGIYMTNDGGKNWQIMNPPPTGDQLHPGLFQPIKFHPKDSSIWYADLGTHNVANYEQYPKGLFVTLDLGKTWHCVSNKELHNHIGCVDYLEFVENRDQYILFATSASGACYSLNYGQKWQMMHVQWKGLPDGIDTKSNMLEYDVIDAQTKDGLIYLKSKKGLLKSVDNGNTWFY